MSEVMTYSQKAMRTIGGAEQPAERRPQLAFIAPRHPGGVDWPWLSQIGAMRALHVRPIYIENTYRRFPKATRCYVKWQYLRAMANIRDADLVFYFSTSIAIGMMRWPANLLSRACRVYVGFTQDGEWDQRQIRTLTRALQQFDVVTVFSDGERQLYIERYGLHPQRVRVIPIHTDETDEYRQYPDERPEFIPPQPYVLSLGSPNRRFMPVAQACRALNIPLVIITRPNHQNDSLAELGSLGATIVTNAKKLEALTYLKHARLGVMCFQNSHLPGAFTTLIHAMFLRTPCVVTSCLGITDYVIDGQTGRVTPHGDDAVLSSAIAELWNSPTTIEQMASCGLVRAQQLFSLEAAASSFSDLARTLLDQRAAAPAPAPAAERPVRG